MWTKPGQAESVLYSVSAARGRLQQAMRETPAGATYQLMLQASDKLVIVEEQIKVAHALLMDIERKNRARRI